MGIISLAHHLFHRELIRDQSPPLGILLLPWALPVSSHSWSYRQTNLSTPRSLAGQPPRPPAGQQYYGPQGSQQPFFQYSQCSGKKKALCVRLLHDSMSKTWHLILTPNQIGINYFRQDAALRGCINDARNIEKFLCGESPLYVSYQAPLSDATCQRDLATNAMI